MKKRATCLRRKCNSLVDSRGLCIDHYRVAYSCVKKGVTTWKKLIDQGQALTTRYENRAKREKSLVKGML